MPPAALTSSTAIFMPLETGTPQTLIGADHNLGGGNAFIGDLGLGCGRQTGQRKGAHRKAQRLERFRHCSLLFVGPCWAKGRALQSFAVFKPLALLTPPRVRHTWR